jgi:hypothetical protein
MEKKAKFPQKLQAKEINFTTKTWLHEYMISTGAPQQAKGYFEKLINFFKYIKFQDKPFNELTESDIEDFVGVLIEAEYTESGINPFISQIIKFRDFLIKKYPETFRYDFLENVSELHFDVVIGDNEDNYFDLQTLSYVRNYIRNDIRLEYIVELILQLGIQKKELELCQPESADLTREMFVVDGSEKSFKDSPIISNLIVKILKEGKKRKISENIFNESLRKLSYHLLSHGVFKRKVTHSTLLNTHRMNHFTCSNCRRSFENISSNWVLAKTYQDDVYRIVCKVCKGEIQDENEHN